MADTFGTITFDVLATTPGGELAVEVSHMHIPGGSTSYMDIGGVLPETLELACHFATDAVYDTMRAALRGTASATLAYWGGTYPSVLLTDLRRTFRAPSGHNFADATFVDIA